MGERDVPARMAANALGSNQRIASAGFINGR
jgi:hypothetical protein